MLTSIRTRCRAWLCAAVAAAGVLGAAPAPAQPPCEQWNQAIPSPRRGAAMAYDEARGRTVLFGGLFAETPRGGTFEWDGSRWWSLTPANSPAPSGKMACGYDAARQRVVVLTASRQTWEWDGATWVNRNIQSPAQTSAPMVYDSLRRRLVLFTGAAGATTWAYNGNAWTSIATGGPTSLAANSPAAAYDPGRDRVVLFGGQAVGAYSDRHWEFDGSVWTERFPPTRPRARSGHVMAFDAVSERVILFGGFGRLDDPFAVALSDTWAWDGTDWERLEVSGPGARAFASIACDRARGRIVMFGGGNVDMFGDTWEWNGSAWIPAMRIPAPRADHAMAYDPAHGTAIVFGGQRDSVFHGDTWHFSGARWERRTIGGPSPSPRAAAGLVFDPVRGHAILFGGFDGQEVQGDTWLYDPAESAWTRLDIPGPSARSGHTMVWDSVRQRAVLFGGDPVGETWEWDAAAGGGAGAWLKAAVTGPSPRFGAAMAYDPVRQRTVLFGGAGPASLGDTWEWDGAAWSQRPAPGAPAARSLAAMVYDPVMGRVILFGSIDRNESHSYAWDGTTWTDITFGPADQRPDGRYGHAMVYDTVNQQVVLFGGYNQNVIGRAHDTWVFKSQAPAIARQPVSPVSAVAPSAVELTTLAATNVAPTYQWRKNGVAIPPNPRFGGLNTATLRINPLRAADQGVYDVLIYNACGSTTGEPITLDVRCAADTDADGDIDPADVSGFVALWLASLESGDLAADFDASGAVNPADVGAFVRAWFAMLVDGC